MNRRRFMERLAAGCGCFLLPTFAKAIELPVIRIAPGNLALKWRLTRFQQSTLCDAGGRPIATRFEMSLRFIGQSQQRLRGNEWLEHGIFRLLKGQGPWASQHFTVDRTRRKLDAELIAPLHGLPYPTPYSI